MSGTRQLDERKDRDDKRLDKQELKGIGIKPVMFEQLVEEHPGERGKEE